ncbi:carbohydrate ABC transporter permease [Facklamia lactis]|nr:carbohydrate ABC transporter permease [Facklamia lactis]
MIMTQSKANKLINTAIAVLFVSLLIFPVIILLNTSLQTYEEIRSWPPTWFTNLKWENYVSVLQGDKSIIEPVKNSAIVSTASMLICVCVGTLAAYAVSRYRFFGSKFFLIIVILTQMFSPVILVTPMYVIFKELDILDTLLSLIIANTASSLPMTIWLLNSYFSAIPKSYEEASWMDGSNRLQGICNVIVPIALPGILTAGIFAFIQSWGDLVYAQSFILSPELRTISLALTDFKDLYKTQWETQMAASFLSSIPTVIIFVIIQKHLIRGMSNQGLKG